MRGPGMVPSGTGSVVYLHAKQIDFWGDVWTLAAWCELRDDFRSFRLDRMSAIAAGAPFDMKPGRTLEDFLARARLPRKHGVVNKDASAP